MRKNESYLHDQCCLEHFLLALFSICYSISPKTSYQLPQHLLKSILAHLRAVVVAQLVE